MISYKIILLSSLKILYTVNVWIDLFICIFVIQSVVNILRVWLLNKYLKKYWEKINLHKI